MADALVENGCEPAAISVWVCLRLSPRNTRPMLTPAFVVAEIFASPGFWLFGTLTYSSVPSAAELTGLPDLSTSWTPSAGLPSSLTATGSVPVVLTVTGPTPGVSPSLPETVPGVSDSEAPGSLASPEFALPVR
ncbi:hypothetical protein ACU686_17455 [Yinghuangia aomiensis]